MSGFIGAAQPTINVGVQDLRNNHQQLKERDAIFVECAEAIATENYATDFWPGSGFFGDGNTDVALLEPSQWSNYDPAAGAGSAFGFTGVTRDANGSAVGGVTVKLFLTATDALLDTVVSDVNTGAFVLRSPYYPNQHYIVAHKVSTPDLDGVSVNTLIGA